jgi:uncharacterized membrane protein YhaH (DUF805 family)
LKSGAANLVAVSHVEEVGMGPVEAVTTCLQKYVGFGGRAGRAEFWWFFLFYLVAVLIGYAIDAAVGAGGILYVVVTLGLILPTIAVEFRRLHDTGRSGWWILITLIPLIGSIWLLVLFASRGDPAPNKYGDPPSAAMAPA